jgi:hypothetical protein
MTNARRITGDDSSREREGKVTGSLLRRWTGGICFAATLSLCAVASAYSQAPPATPLQPEAQKQVAPAPVPATPPTTPANDDDQPLPGDWGPGLLYGILSSPNDEASFALLRATFAAGPAVIPQLVEALKDDRTAEFAAQSLAYIGGEQALPALEGLLSDPRDLNLRRFTYGALGEFDTAKATDMLFDVIDKSDAEQDRTVTEAAVIALTVRTEPAVVSRILESEKKLQDVVIRDDLDNARVVIEARSKYLASAQGATSGGSIESAVRTYFLPALDLPVTAPAPASTAIIKTPGKPAAPAARTLKPLAPLVTVDVRSVTFSPDKSRALARVIFQDPTAMASYDFVLEKRVGGWELASVWLGLEVDKTPPEKTPAPSDK